MEFVDGKMGVKYRWRRDERLNTGDSTFETPDTNGKGGSVASAASAYATEREDTVPQWEVEGNPLEFGNSTLTREQHGPEHLTAPQYIPTSSNRMESIRPDTQTSRQCRQEGLSNHLAPQPNRKATGDFWSGQDGTQNAVLGNNTSGSELFHQAHHFVIQGSEFVGQKIIQNHSPSATEVLGALENPIGTSWDPARACLPGTRADIIQDAVKWLSTVPTAGTAGLYLVADAVGTGKSSLAHTVAGEVHNAGYLAASFFFNQLNREISTTRHLFGALVRGLCSVNEHAEDVAVKILRADSMLVTAPPTRQFDYLCLPICRAFPHNRPLAIVIDALDEGFDEDLMAIFQDRVPLLPSNVRIMATTRPEDRIMAYLDPGQRSHIHRCPYPLSGASGSNDVEQYIKHELHNGKKLALTPELETDFIQKSKGFFLWTETVLKHIKRAHDPAGELAQILDAGGTEWWRNGADAGQRLDALFDRVIANLDSKDSKFVSTYTDIVGALVTAKEPLSSETLEKLYASAGISLAAILDTVSRIQSLLDNFDPNSPQKPILFLHLSVRQYLTERAPHPFRLDVSDHHPVLCYATLRVIDQETNLDTFPFLGFSKDINSPHLSFDGNRIPQHLCYAYKFLIDHLVNSQPSDVQPACINLLAHVLNSKGRELLETSAMMQSLLDVGRLRSWALEVFRGHQAPLRIIHAAEGDFGEALHDIGRWLCNRGMSPVGLMPLKTYTEMCRLLSAGGSRSRDPNRRRLALSLNSLAKCQMRVGDRNSGVATIEEALPIWRGLAASNQMKRIVIKPFIHNRTKYKLERLDTLFNLCGCLAIAEKYQEAVEAAKGLVEKFRQLARNNPNSFEAYPPQGLIMLSKCLTKVEDHGSALGAAQESVQILHRLFASTPAKHELWLADALSVLRDCLVNVGEHQGAAEAAKELVKMIRQLSSKNRNHYKTHLAYNLMVLSKCLMKVDDHESELAAAQESVQIFRPLFASNPLEHELFLADALTVLRDCLADVGRHQEAAKAAKELVEINRQLSSRNPNHYETHLAYNLMALSKCLMKANDHESAFAAAQGSVQIFRPLFASNPAEHDHWLADALVVFRDCLTNVGKHQEAAEAANELVKLNRQLSSKNPNHYETHLAYNLMVLSKCLTKVNDHGSALAAAQGSVQIFRPLFARFPTEHEIMLAEALLSFRDCLINMEKHQAAAEAAKELVEMDRQLTSKNPNHYERNFTCNLIRLSKCLTKVDDHRSALFAAEEGVKICRWRFANNPAEYEDLMLWALATLCESLTKVGMHEGALGVAEEVVELGRQFTSKNPTFDLRRHAEDLLDLSKCLTKVDALPAALVTVQEAVAVYHNLYSQDGVEHKAALEDSFAREHEILSKLQNDSNESATETLEVDMEMNKLDYY